MRLTSGGIREMHWHQFAEWAYMTYSNCRITVLDEVGRPYVADVKEGDLWYFPAGFPHSLQGLEPDGCEFLLVFDEGQASEFSTLLVTDWFANTPPNVLAENFGVPAEEFANIPLRERYIFQGKLPGSLEADREAVSGNGAPPHPFTFPLRSMAPSRETRGGIVRIADSRNFTVSETIAAAHLTIRPDGMREMHWHPNADEWQYWIKGKGTMTVFNTGPNATTHGDDREVSSQQAGNRADVRDALPGQEIRVPRIVGAFAAGRLMNTRAAHSKSMGGMICGSDRRTRSDQD
jgi:oxalate decarboxylase